MENFSPELPMELITEVLARLPVKSLVRFRCVCKAWYSLISSSDFAPLHLSCFHNNDNTAACFLGMIWPPHRTSSGCVETCRWIPASCETYEKITQDEYSILYNRTIMDRFDYGYFPCGSSVNGVLLLAKASFDPEDGRVRRELELWNPMIGKTRKITPYFGDACPLVGLGYSHSRNDYKVVAITRGGNSNTPVQVYSLRTGRWRNIVGYKESIRHGLGSDGSSLLQGTICFVSLNFVEQSSHMVLFDVDDEVLKYIELPSELGVEGQWKYPVMYRGKIGLLNIAPHDDQCTLWVTGKDQVVGSWTKLYALHLHEVISPSSMLFFKNDGEFMLLNYRGDVGIYDVESGEVKHLTGDFSHLRVYCTPYKESLVLL